MSGSIVWLFACILMTVFVGVVFYVDFSRRMKLNQAELPCFDVKFLLYEADVGVALLFLCS